MINHETHEAHESTNASSSDIFVSFVSFVVSSVKRKADSLPRELVKGSFEKTRSLHPADYRDITVNASFILSLLGAYFDSAQAAPPR